MRRALFSAAAAAIILFAVGGSPAAARTTAVGVTEREFRIALHRREVKPGTVRFNITNRGEDSHDLVVLDLAGEPLAASDELRPGGRTTLAVDLTRRGAYTVFCSVGDHAARGMTAKLKVTRKPRRTRGSDPRVHKVTRKPRRAAEIATPGASVLARSRSRS